MCNKGIYDIYIASCTQTGGIYHYKLQDGVLTFADFTPMDRPMYGVVQDGKLYVILRAPFENEESGVVVYDLDDQGKPVNPSPIQSTHGIVACHILVDAGEVYCANYISGSVCKLPGQVAQHQGNGPHPTRQDGPHAHFVGLTPDKKFLCVADLGCDTVFLYDRNLVLHSQVKVPAGHGVRHLAFSQDGKWMFSANELASTVSVFSYKDGTLELVDTCSVIPEGFVGETTAAAIRVQDGYIYMSNRGLDTISKLSFDGKKLTLLANIPCGGKSPRDFCFAGKDLLCTNQDSNCVTLLDETGKLLQEIPMEMPIWVTAKSRLEVATFDGPGYQPQFDCNGWRVALANYTPKLELFRLDFLERHLETDEVFVLLQGHGGLFIGQERTQVDLEAGKLFNVKKGVWHRVYMSPGAKMLIVENTDTGPHNTEYLHF